MDSCIICSVAKKWPARLAKRKQHHTRAISSSQWNFRPSDWPQWKLKQWQVWYKGFWTSSECIDLGLWLWKLEDTRSVCHSIDHLPEQTHVDSVSQSLAREDDNVDDVGDDANRKKHRKNANVDDVLHSHQDTCSDRVCRFVRRREGSGCCFSDGIAWNYRPQQCAVVGTVDRPFSFSRAHDYQSYSQH